jgi:hypothetical protein
LELGYERFIAYSFDERRRLKEKLRRFFTCAHDPVFGDGVTPSSAETSARIFDQYIDPAAWVHDR